MAIAIAIIILTITIPRQLHQYSGHIAVLGGDCTGGTEKGQCRSTDLIRLGKGGGREGREEERKAIREKEGGREGDEQGKGGRMIRITYKTG